MNIGPATKACLAPINGGGLQVRTGGSADALALPMWCKSLTNNTSREETSELNNNSRRYFFDLYLPGYLAGFIYMLSHQRQHQLSQSEPKPTSYKPAGFFNDTNDTNITKIDPAFAGSINVLTNNHSIPTMSRDFSCTKENF